MTVPALVVQQPGIGVQTADNMNTPVMGGCLLANLQNFVGVPGMTAYMVGYAAAGDGGQGVWSWNAGVAAGDNKTSILPNGSVQGGWVRVSQDLSPAVAYQYVVPLTGFSVAFAPPAQILVLNPAGALAAGGVVFPAGVADGYRLTISTSQTITALALSGGTISNAVTTLAAGAAASYVWVAAASTWFRG